MTEEEAKRVLDAAAEQPYVQLDRSEKYVRLDGLFTVEELEAVIVLKRASGRR